VPDRACVCSALLLLSPSRFPPFAQKLQKNSQQNAKRPVRMLSAEPECINSVFILSLVRADSTQQHGLPFFVVEEIYIETHNNATVREQNRKVTFELTR
jgi:hypothetical protein